MAFKFSDSKFSSNMWRMLKDHISKGNSSAANDTHYVCCYTVGYKMMTTCHEGVS